MKTILVVGARGIPDVEGGVEKAVEQIFPRMAKRGWRIIVAGLKSHITTTDFQGVELLPAPKSRVFGTDKLAYYIYALIKAARSKPDIVYLAGLGSAITLFGYKLIGCKIVVRYGSADYLLPKWGLLGRLGFRLAEQQLRFADVVVAVAPALVKRLEKRGIARSIVAIPNALDAPIAKDTEEPTIDGPFILAVGRVTAQKNLHMLCKAFEIFRQSHQEAKLVLVGGLDDRKYLKSLGPIAPGVKLVGQIPRSHLTSYFKQAHLFINCSIHEGHSNAILEAIGHQCPVLLSDIVENKDFGLSSKHYFDPMKASSIVSALSRAWNGREQYCISRDGFQTWDEVAERTEIVCRNLVYPVDSHEIEECPL